MNTTISIIDIVRTFTDAALIPLVAVGWKLSLNVARLDANVSNLEKQVNHLFATYERDRKHDRDSYK